MSKRLPSTLLERDNTVRLSKVAVIEGLQTYIDRGMTIEVDALAPNQKVGMAAFQGRRQPTFTGKQSIIL